MGSNRAISRLRALARWLHCLSVISAALHLGRDGVIRDIVIGGPMSEALIASKVEGLLAEEDK